MMLLFFFAALHALVLAAFWRGNEGRIAGGVFVVSVVPLILGGSYLLQRLTSAMSWLDTWVLIYAGWSVLSAVLYLQAGNPSDVGAYAYGLYNFVLPIACYFAAKSIPREQHAQLLSGLVLLNAFAIAYGLYLHLTRPDYYLTFLTGRLAQSGATEEWQYFARLQSYLGSTSIGYMGAVSLVLATLSTARVRRLLPILAVVFVAGSALSLQRASFVGLAMGLAYLILLFRQKVALRLLTLATFAGALIYAGVHFASTADPLKETLQSRATTDMAEGLSGFTVERGYGQGLRYLRSFPLGVGLGATSSAADNAGLVGKGEVTDANFMRIAADLGILGLLLFLIVVAAATRSAWRSFHRMAWLTFLLIHCGIMLSTNVLDSFYISHGFWLLIAVIDCDHDSVLVILTQHVSEGPVVSPTTALV